MRRPAKRCAMIVKRCAADGKRPKEKNMTQREAIEEVVYEVLKDGEVHSADELQRICLKRGIINEKQRRAIRGTIYNLKKKDKRIVTVVRGKYKLEGEKVCTTIEDEVKSIRKRIEELKKIGWLNTNDTELNRARQDVEALKQLKTEIENLIKNIK